MKVAGNKISDVLRFYREHLNSLYGHDEIDELAFIAFNHVYGWNKDEFRKKSEERINQSELLIIYDIAKALGTGQPIQYVIGKAHFFGLDFHVNKHVLIPRQETEELVHLVLQEYQKDNKNDIRILDIGTGSGCIPIAIKKNAKEIHTHAIDVSGAALDVARHNAEKNDVVVHFLHADIFELRDFGEMKFDYIISNPPYICKSERPEMSSTVTEHEPHLALFVENEDPMLFYNAIAKFAIKNLSPNGKLFFEINQKFGKEVVELLENKGFLEVDLIKDINGNDRIVKANFV